MLSSNSTHLVQQSIDQSGMRGYSRPHITQFIIAIRRGKRFVFPIYSC